MNNKAFLQLPPGSTGLFLEEAAHHQAAIDSTNRLFSSWGYTMVHTPMLDYFDAHSHILNEIEQDRIYRLIGRDGEVLMIRSDITVFLLKHFHSLLKGATLPLRLAYSDSIVRHEESVNISLNDHYQTGAELIGNNPEEEDMEILLLLCENLQALGIDRPAVHLGSRSLFNAVFSAAPEKEYLKEEIQTAVVHRDWQGVGSRMHELNLCIEKDSVVRLFSTLCNSDDPELADLSTAMPISLESIVSDEIRYLRETASALSGAFPEIRFRIDLSEIGQRRYYSGTVFCVYADGLPFPVASGGRYDTLLERMALPGGAVGYSLMLGALHKLVADGTPPPLFSVKSEMPSASLLERYQRAKQLRGEGKSVCL